MNNKFILQNLENNETKEYKSFKGYIEGIKY